MTLRDLQRTVHALAREKGWWDLQPGESAPNIPEKLALIHSEISEALEEFRKAPGEIRETYSGEHGKPEGFPVELADAVIRIMDLCGWLGVDLEKEIILKHEFNRDRPYRHGKAC